MSDVNKKVIEKGYNYTMHVFDGYIYDPESDDLIAKCDALSESALSLETEMTEKRGGSQNAVLFSIPTSKTLTVNLTNMDFDEKRLALQTGEKFAVGEYTVYGRTASCQVSEVSGKRTITLPEAPVGVSVYVESGESVIKAAVDSANPETVDVTAITGENDACLNVIYAAAVKSAQLDIKAGTAPAVVKLVLKKKVYNGTGGAAVKLLTITIPKFQLDGNMEFAGTLGDSDTMTMNGTAQSSQSIDCGSAEQSLGSINVEYIGEDALKAEVLSTAAGYEVAAGASDYITVFASKGDSLTFEPYEVTDDCSFASDDATIATVDSNGKITGVAAGAATVTIGYQELTTTTVVTVL